ncbi:MAG: hypothetical protein GQF41_3759 [Candidatus Rifleibacterium amylolyticum]|nr:MAG: hypothetical protein GQF41_3759 [Candidatus Rifleibacterium amylolyticum]
MVKIRVEEADMAPIKSQNLSIMLTDIQGYSTTTASASRDEVVGLIRRHNQLMRPVIEFYNGRIVKSIGDAFLCTFGSATDAVICAIIIQLLLKEYNQRLKDESHKLNLRVVINSGDVSIEGDDIFGNAVNVTARMEGLECFPGGSIGISESTYLLMDRNEIVAEIAGLEKLKGIPDPVNVFRVPVEKQKLNQLPVQLLNLVEKVANAKGDGQNSEVSEQINEWTQSVSNFLKQTNWGDNINKASHHIGKVQKSLVKTFGQKTVLEKKKELNDASIAARFKSGIIDMIILIIISVGLKIAWWPIQSILFGTPEYADPGLLESLMSLNFRYPIVVFWLYFAVFWKIKQASPGQIAVGTAVVNENGVPDLSFAMVAKRSLLFLLSNFILIGTAMVFVGEKKTFYDKTCNTRVVE